MGTLSGGGKEVISLGERCLLGANAGTRTSLYRALSLAYDFAVAAQRDPEDYAELLEESGVKAQARAPMTPVVKLVFGVDYDKARLTEFAAALSYAQRQEIGTGGFEDFITKQPGGLKALVAAERQARRPEGKPETRTDEASAKLRRCRWKRSPAPTSSASSLHAVVPMAAMSPWRWSTILRSSRRRSAGLPELH